MNKVNPTLRYVISGLIYGTIGVFLHFINFSSEFVVLCRGIIGSLFICAIMLINKDLPNIKSIKDNLLLLLISGICLGLNWIFLFAGYKYSVAITCLLNYFAPIIVVIISAVVYKEKLVSTQIICIAFALAGVILVSGIFDGAARVDVHCVIYGLLAAASFVVIVLCNRKMSYIKPLDKTLVQLFASAITVLPYVIMNNSFPKTFDVTSVVLVIILGIVNTGFAYILYFNSINSLSIDKVAILGYVEPVLSIILGVLVLKEKITIFGIFGTEFIIISAAVNELIANKNRINGGQ